MITEETLKYSQFKRIKEQLAKFTGFPVRELMHPTKGIKELSHTRMIGYWICKSMIPCTEQEIANHFRRQRETICYGIEQVKLRRYQFLDYKFYSDTLLGIFGDVQPVECMTPFGLNKYIINRYSSPSKNLTLVNIKPRHFEPSQNTIKSIESCDFRQRANQILQNPAYPKKEYRNAKMS